MNHCSCSFWKLKIVHSKLNQHRQGNEVLISKGDTLTCPVSICRHYVLLSKLNLNSEFYIIWSIYRHKGRYTWECVWYGNVNCRRISMKIRVSQATSLKCALFSSICIYQCACLSLFVCVCVSLLLSIILVFRFLLTRSKEQTNEETYRQLFLILYTHRFARGY